MTNKKNRFKEYFITILACSFIATVFSFCIELDLLFRSEKKVNNEELKTANLSKFCTIGELEKRLLNEPSNYLVSIKLATIYESLQKNNKANEYYINALKLSGRSNYSLYMYACFCAKRKLYGIASAFAEEISGNNLTNIKYKAKIYEAIGNTLFDNKEYPASTKAYQVSYKYAKNMKDKKHFNNIKEKYAQSYSKSADWHMENNLIEEAISDLENSLKIKRNAQASYKLALIYKDIDKVKAQKNMEDALKSNPFVVNPYIYNDLLNDLIEESKTMGNYNALNLYSVKLNAFKKQMEKSYIYKNDIIIDNSMIYARKKRFSKEPSYFLSFDIKNNTKSLLDELYIEVELFVNSKRYVTKKKIINYANAVDSYEIKEKNIIALPPDIQLINIKDKNDITVKYYAKKQKRAPWTLLKFDFINF